MALDLAQLFVSILQKISDTFTLERMLRFAVVTSLLLLLIFLVYHPAPSDKEVRDKIKRQLINREIYFYTGMGSSRVAFRLSEGNIAGIEKETVNGQTQWLAIIRSGPYMWKAYYDQYGDKELSFEQMPVQ